MIARATIPTSQTRVGTELHHSEGQRGARVGVTMSARADKRIDITSQILLGRDEDWSQEQ